MFIARLLILPLLVACKSDPQDDSDTDRDTDGDTDVSTWECGAESAGELGACGDLQRYEEDLVFVAKPRQPGSDNWLAAQNRCANTFSELGFDVELHDYGTGINVLGKKVGNIEPEETVIVGAHYDHFSFCAGADDNASGVAGVLEAARVLATAEFKKTLLFACWDEEERGLIGSQAWVDRAVRNGENVVVYYNYEMIAFYSDEPLSQTVPFGFDLLFPSATTSLAENEYRGNFLAVVNNTESHHHANYLIDFGPSFGLLTEMLEVTSEQQVVAPDLARSDHAPFWEQGWPAMMLTDTANFRNPNYHCVGGPDTVDTLDLEFAISAVRTTVAAVATSAGVIE